jgi:hypothetical protein
VSDLPKEKIFLRDGKLPSNLLLILYHTHRVVAVAAGAGGARSKALQAVAEPPHHPAGLFVYFFSFFV